MLKSRKTIRWTSFLRFFNFLYISWFLIWIFMNIFICFEILLFSNIFHFKLFYWKILRDESISACHLIVEFWVLNIVRKFSWKIIIIIEYILIWEFKKFENLKFDLEYKPISFYSWTDSIIMPSLRMHWSYQETLHTCTGLMEVTSSYNF